MLRYPFQVEWTLLALGSLKRVVLCPKVGWVVKAPLVKIKKYEKRKTKNLKIIGRSKIILKKYFQNETKKIFYFLSFEFFLNLF
jgi:hypothetical protein